jgi:hypothetical protein
MHVAAGCYYNKKKARSVGRRAVERVVSEHLRETRER